MTEEKSNNFVPGVRKLIKGKHPGVKVKPPTVGVLAQCVEEFLKLIIQSSAQICEDQQRNTMTGAHVTSALEQMGFSSLVAPVKEKQEKVTESITIRKEEWNKKKTNNLTAEEEIEAMKRLRAEAIAKVRARKKEG